MSKRPQTVFYAAARLIPLGCVLATFSTKAARTKKAAMLRLNTQDKMS
jgi:hypothetical protein